MLSSVFLHKLQVLVELIGQHALPAVILEHRSRSKLLTSIQSYLTLSLSRNTTRDVTLSGGSSTGQKRKSPAEGAEAGSGASKRLCNDAASAAKVLEGTAGQSAEEEVVRWVKLTCPARQVRNL